MPERPDWIPHQRRSIAYFPGMRPERWEVDPMAHMFTEDIWLGILPNEYKARLDSAEPGVDTVAEILPGRDSGFRMRPSELVTDFVEDTARSLAARGEVWYELVRPPAGLANPKPPFALVEIPAATITPVASWIVQHVPPPDFGQRHARYIAIPQRDTWHLTLPRELGSPRAHRALLRLLGSSPFPPELVLDAMRPGAPPGAYDFSVHRRAHQAAIARATRQWGWTARGMWSEEASEHFLTYRALRFRRAQILLRSHIVDGANALFRREAAPAWIAIDGAATIAMVDAMLARLQVESVATSEILTILRQ